MAKRKVVVETVDDRTFKEKAKDLWERTKQKAKDVGQWVKDNKEITAMIAVSALGLAAEVSKTKRKAMSYNGDAKDKCRRIYDNQAGHYIYTRRPITQEQFREIDRRHRDGENYYDILDDMDIKTMK